MRYVQVVLTDSQVGLLSQAVANALVDVNVVDGVEREQLGQLADFLYAVEANPAGFPVKSPDMARALKKRVARLKGPAQPARPNARKRTQARKIGFSKRTRVEKRIQASLYNAAREAAQAELIVEQEREERERIAATGLILPDSR
jgi:signal transduction histidine kinase